MGVREWYEEERRKRIKESNPNRTILQDLLQKYPNASLNREGFPEKLCPYELGYEKEPEDTYTCFLNCTCKDCWNRPLSEVTK